MEASIDSLSALAPDKEYRTVPLMPLSGSRADVPMIKSATPMGSLILTAYESLMKAGGLSLISVT